MVAGGRVELPSYAKEAYMLPLHYPALLSQDSNLDIPSLFVIINPYYFSLFLFFPFLKREERGTSQGLFLFLFVYWWSPTAIFFGSSFDSITGISSQLVSSGTANISTAIFVFVVESIARAFCSSTDFGNNLAS